MSRDEAKTIAYFRCCGGIKTQYVNIKPQKDVRQIDVAVLSEAVSKRGTGENKEGSDQLYDTVYTNATFIIRQRLLFCLV